jgi:hypothetical protein
MNELLGAIVLAISVEITLVAYLAVMAALFPQRVARARGILEAAPIRSLLVGLVNFLFFGALALALSAAAGEPGQMLALVVLLIPAAVAGLGLSALAQIIARQLKPDALGLAQTAWGGMPLSLACAFPFLGWFVLLPAVLLACLGAVILGWFQRTSA